MNTLSYVAVLSLVAVVAGCAGAGPTAAEREAAEAAKAEALEDILNTPLAAEAYGGEGDRCLSTHDYRSVEVLDDSHVLFKGRGGRLWLNTLRQRCIGLRRNDILQFELRDNRVCELDSFRSLDDLMHSVRISGTCILGEFTPVTPEQAEAIEVAFREARES